MQPFNPMSLNSQYAARAQKIFAQYGSNARSAMHQSDSLNPFLLYVAFAHTHTPLAYNETLFGNASDRPGRRKIFGNTLAEVDHSIGEIINALEAEGLRNNTLVLVTADVSEQYAVVVSAVCRGWLGSEIM